MIAQIKMTNCQSWAGTTLHLSTDKVNILRAPNNTGKSVLFKMLRVVAYPNYYNKKERKDLIRWGADFAQIAFAFTSRAVCLVNVYPDKNIYLWREPDTTEFVQSLEPPQKLIDELSLVLGTRHQYIANIIDKEQELILVNSKAQDDYDLISLITQNEDLELLKQRIPQLYSEYRSYTTMAVAKLNTLEYQLKQVQYVDIDAATAKLERDELLLSTMYSLIDLYDILEIFQKRELKDIDFEFLLEIIQFCQQVEELKAHVEKCFVGQKPMGTEKVDVLLSLEQLLQSLPLLYTEAPAANIGKVDALALLEDLFSSLQRCNLPAEVSDASILKLESLQALEQLYSAFTNIAAALDTKENSTQEKVYLQQELLSQGTVYQCPVHKGGVLFDGENCIPTSI